ncbi:hypothetical protein ACQ86G_04185 [Roseateles chitinivorans]|uniref:hypothetical protein n=1 Tax=Roseateles chitinivorans TaxID=2917965 RepID=UPI003D66AF71
MARSTADDRRRLGLERLCARHRHGPALPRHRFCARALGALARQAFDAGLAEDAANALPLYVRDKVALTTAEREAAKGAITR